MRHEFSLAHLSALSLSPPEMVDVAARTGYRYVGLRLIPVTPTEPRYPLAQDQDMMRETCASLADTGVDVLDIELARLTPDVDVFSFAPLLEAGAQLGARHVIAQAPDAERSRAIEHFAQLCELARQFKLGVDLEFVTWTPTADLDAAAAIVKAADQVNGGILVDTLHFCRSGCKAEALRSLPRDWFRFAQVCDAPAQAPETTEGLIHAARNERRFLGEGGLDVRGILNELPAGIPYSLEIPMTTLGRTLGPEVRAHMAILSARRYLESAAHKRDAAVGA
jgi:sugar phosphate isomerase/epimerase